MTSLKWLHFKILRPQRRGTEYGHKFYDWADKRTGGCTQLGRSRNSVIAISKAGDSSERVVTARIGSICYPHKVAGFKLGSRRRMPFDLL